MTNHLGRLYAAAGTIVVFFVLWATVAAHPWTSPAQVTPQDPRLLALTRREKALRARAAAVKHVVDRRWTAYERRLRRRQWENEVALQRHLRNLETSQAAALRAAHAYQAQAQQARAYAASVVAWADAQVATLRPSSVSAAPATAQSTAPAGGAASGQARTTAPAAGGNQAPAPVSVATVAASAPPTSASTAPAPAPAPAPPATPAPVAAAAPAPVSAPPPVQIVTLPPATTTQPSAKKR